MSIGAQSSTIGVQLRDVRSLRPLVQGVVPSHLPYPHHAVRPRQRENRAPRLHVQHRVPRDLREPVPVGSRQHLERYLGEFDFRYSNNESADTDRTDAALRGIEGKRLMYRPAISA